MSVLNSNIVQDRSDRSGQRVPDMVFRLRANDSWADVSSESLFAGQTVALFSLPGAFTPTCSSSHLPRYNELAPALKAAGVDRIFCLSVNDAFVMDAWQREQDAADIEFLADGNGVFTAGMGMLVEKEDLGFGHRSWRYSMLVRDGLIEKMFIEPDLPGDPFEVSDADTLLGYLQPEVELQPDITVVSKPGCPHCARARQALDDRGLRYESLVLGQAGVSWSTLRALSGGTTAPQVFVGGQAIGGADDLELWLQDRNAA